MDNNEINHEHTHGVIDPTIISNEVRHGLLHHRQFLSNATIHAEPTSAYREKFHDRHREAQA